MATGNTPRTPHSQPTGQEPTNPMTQGPMNPMMGGQPCPPAPGMMGPTMGNQAYPQWPGAMGPMMGGPMPPQWPGAMGPMPPQMPGMMGPMNPQMTGMMGPMMQPTYGPIPGFIAPYGAFHCPACGYSGPEWHTGPSPSLGYAGPAFGPYAGPGTWGLGGLRQWGGTYSPQFTATGLPTDEEIEEMVYDAMDADPLIPYDADIDVSVDAGVVTISGTVPNKRIKHASGDNAWWVPGVVDVNNELAVSGRRKSRNAPPEQTTT